MLRSTAKIVSCLLICLSATGCERRIGGDHYSQSSIGEASETYQGMIASARVVQVGQEQLGDNTLGALGGGALGGLAGSQIGRGGTSNFLAIGGALAGAVGGAYAEDYLKKQEAMEYVIRLNNGQMRTVVQGPEPRLAPGQRVLVVVGRDARSRVMPDFSGINEVQQMAAVPHEMRVSHTHRSS